MAAHSSILAWSIPWTEEPGGAIRDLGSVTGLGRSPGDRKGSPLQYSGLEDSMDCMESRRGIASPVAIRMGEGAQRKRCPAG